MKKKQQLKTSSHSNPSRYPTYYNGERAYVGDLVRYHNLIDVSNYFNSEDKELYLLADISEEMVGIKQDTEDPAQPIEHLEWLADIRNNNNSHMVNLCYLMKVKGE